MTTIKPMPKREDYSDAQCSGKLLEWTWVSAYERARADALQSQVTALVPLVKELRGEIDILHDESSECKVCGLLRRIDAVLREMGKI